MGHQHQSPGQSEASSTCSIDFNCSDPLHKTGRVAIDLAGREEFSVEFRGISPIMPVVLMPACRNKKHRRPRKKLGSPSANLPKTNQWHPCNLAKVLQATKGN